MNKKFFTIDGIDKIPIIKDGKFNEEINQLLCKEVEFKIKNEFSSTIRGRGTVVFGAGGNTDQLIIIVDDREMNRICDMRFSASLINYGFRSFEMEVIK